MTAEVDRLAAQQQPRAAAERTNLVWSGLEAASECDGHGPPDFGYEFNCGCYSTGMIVTMVNPDDSTDRATIILAWNGEAYAQNAIDAPYYYTMSAHIESGDGLLFEAHLAPGENESDDLNLTSGELYVMGFSVGTLWFASHGQRLRSFAQQRGVERTFGWFGTHRRLSRLRIPHGKQ